MKGTPSEGLEGQESQVTSYATLHERRKETVQDQQGAPNEVSIAAPMCLISVEVMSPNILPCTGLRALKSNSAGTQSWDFILRIDIIPSIELHVGKAILKVLSLHSSPKNNC